MGVVDLGYGLNDSTVSVDIMAGFKRKLGAFNVKALQVNWMWFKHTLNVFWNTLNPGYVISDAIH